ncbi:hypothetical protein GMES_1034 [Paraglaciecola mesophila KMM 241]|uniref:Uncharacterized protein n=1 Tax=Paraglaciecola mesophila KMM 241 TaxID=1128912 RepID=K6Z2X9_9ALTE|nr:hypothetical protein [Paraglaciecola mesophila]GAC23333.1 hypothetical protein GMES_1034 [Paraglaciecola mesophila KMM 241]
MRHFLTYLFLSSVMVVSLAHAQQTESTQQASANDAASAEQENILFGDENQPGRTIHSEIVTLVQGGATLDEAVRQTITNVTREDEALISGSARLVVGLNKGISANFMRNMVDFNKLTDSTKGSIEAFPSDAGEIIRLAVTLYPSFAQDVIDSAITTGEIEPNDALLAAISAGADPTTVSAATAAGANVAVTATPAGTGVGAGGAGGGDTTASTN